ncbi:MAG TPA: hypothetical protein PKA28_06325 [Methylomusa anaerophila]|uniref:Uncharacterized protein n=1 Tax=Methylomusa anaerophila TaxID=1930071 RepID=A0A348ALJ0_9FIRM|nr:hypothetical protein [Methylomusa anaerophila]BBB91938.1 hypothetical protein MAMMFC1_02623 [Methylomusa anaerophila]HML88050.1 hypothetical protein [Methylomusa anaerophila]
MKNSKAKAIAIAIVTLAIGENYFWRWKDYCEANWQEYAAKHVYDII